MYNTFKSRKLYVIQEVPESSLPSSFTTQCFPKEIQNLSNDCTHLKLPNESKSIPKKVELGPKSSDELDLKMTPEMESHLKYRRVSNSTYVDLLLLEEDDPTIEQECQ